MFVRVWFGQTYAFALHIFMWRGGRVLQHACTHPDLHKHTTSQYLLIPPPPQTFLRSLKPADLTLEEAGSRLRQALDKVRAWVMLSSCHICVPVTCQSVCFLFHPFTLSLTPSHSCVHNPTSHPSCCQVHPIHHGTSTHSLLHKTPPHHMLSYNYVVSCE